MNWTLIILLIVSILVVYLIFKLIKKVVFAVITVVILFTVVIGGIFGFAYLDFKQLSEKQNFDIYLVEGTPENPQLGLVIPIENQEINAEDLQSIDLTQITPEIVEEEETDFYVFISEGFYEEEILIEDREFYFLGTQEYQVEGINLNMTLSKEEVDSIYNSTEPTQEFVEILIANNPELEPLVQLGLEDVIVENFENELELRNLDFEDALFASTIISSIQEDQSLIYEILRAYQEGEIEIYPERFSFKLLKLAPIGLVESLIPQQELAENTNQTISS